MITVTAAKFTRNFGRWRTAAHKEPLSITSHGNEDLVVISIDEYRRLKLCDHQVLTPGELTAEDIAALQRDDIPKKSAAFDNELER